MTTNEANNTQDTTTNTQDVSKQSDSTLPKNNPGVAQAAVEAQTQVSQLATQVKNTALSIQSDVPGLQQDNFPNVSLSGGETFAPYGTSNDKSGNDTNININDQGGNGNIHINDNGQNININFDNGNNGSRNANAADLPSKTYGGMDTALQEKSANINININDGGSGAGAGAAGKGSDWGAGGGGAQTGDQNAGGNGINININDGGAAAGAGAGGGNGSDWGAGGGGAQTGDQNAGGAAAAAGGAGADGNPYPGGAPTQATPTAAEQQVINNLKAAVDASTAGNSQLSQTDMSLVAQDLQNMGMQLGNPLANAGTMSAQQTADTIQALGLNQMDGTGLSQTSQLAYDARLLSHDEQGNGAANMANGTGPSGEILVQTLLNGANNGQGSTFMPDQTQTQWLMQALAWSMDPTTNQINGNFLTDTMGLTYNQSAGGSDIMAKLNSENYTNASLNASDVNVNFPDPTKPGGFDALAQASGWSQTDIAANALFGHLNMGTPGALTNDQVQSFANRALNDPMGDPIDNPIVTSSQEDINWTQKLANDPNAAGDLLSSFLSGQAQQLGDPSLMGVHNFGESLNGAGGGGGAGGDWGTGAGNNGGININIGGGAGGDWATGGGGINININDGAGAAGAGADWGAGGGGGAGAGAAGAGADWGAGGGGGAGAGAAGAGADWGAGGGGAAGAAGGGANAQALDSLIQAGPGVNQQEIQQAMTDLQALPVSVQDSLIASGNQIQLMSGFQNGDAQGQNDGQTAQVYVDSGMFNQALIHETSELAGQNTTNSPGLWSDQQAVNMADQALSQMSPDQANAIGDLNDTIGTQQGDGDLISNVIAYLTQSNSPQTQMDDPGTNQTELASVQAAPQLVAYEAQALGLPDPLQGQA